MYTITNIWCNNYTFLVKNCPKSNFISLRMYSTLWSRGYHQKAFRNRVPWDAGPLMKTSHWAHICLEVDDQNNLSLIIPFVGDEEFCSLDSHVGTLHLWFMTKYTLCLVLMISFGLYPIPYWSKDNDLNSQKTYYILSTSQ